SVPRNQRGRRPQRSTQPGGAATRQQGGGYTAMTVHIGLMAVRATFDQRIQARSKIRPALTVSGVNPRAPDNVLAALLRRQGQKTGVGWRSRVVQSRSGEDFGVR